MKRFEAEQEQKSSNSNNACIEVFTCTAVGGGAI